MSTDLNKPVDDPYADARAAMEEIKAGQVETPAEKPNDPPADAAPQSDPVAAEPAADKPTDGRARDEKGRFAKKEGEPQESAPAKDPAAPAEPAKQPDKAPAEGAAQAAGPEGTAPVGPPTSWAVGAKAQWDKLSPEVKAAIAKRESEIAAGSEKYKGYRALDPYVEMAQRSGTTLDAALKAYTGLEDMLRRDPVQGLVQVAQNLGWSRDQAAQHFARIAQGLGYTGFAAPAHHNGQDPAQQGQNGAPQNGAGVHPELLQLETRVISPLLQRVNEVEQHFVRQREAEELRQAQNAARIGAAFRADPANKYFDNVAADIDRLFKTGVVPLTDDLKGDLQKAYDMACWNNPEVREALINERVTKTTEDQAAKDRAIAAAAAKASRSVSGSPAPETRVHTPRKPGEADDPYADAREAMAEIRGRA